MSPDQNDLCCEPGSEYDAEYFGNRFGPIPYDRNQHWWLFFWGIADQIIRSLNPKRVFDAGCAMGLLVEAFWDRGVEARGVDISSYAISKVRPDMKPHCRLGSLVDPIDGRYDLVTCIEVLEHMQPEEAQVAIRNLTAASDAVRRQLVTFLHSFVTTGTAVIENPY